MPSWARSSLWPAFDGAGRAGIARVHAAAGITAVSGTLEGGGKVDGRNQITVGFGDAPETVDGQRFKGWKMVAHGILDIGHS